MTPKFLPIPMGAALLLLGAASLFAQEAPKTAAEAWEHLDGQSSRVAIPPDWRTRQPLENEIAKWKTTEGDRLSNFAAEAHDFTVKYPKDAHLARVREKEDEALAGALRLGVPDAQERIAALDTERLADPDLSKDAKLTIRIRQVQLKARAAMEKDGREAAEAAYIQGARELMKEFPESGDPYAMILEAANNAGPEQARPLLKELIEGKGPDEVKEQAKSQLARLDAVGKPLDLKYTALDGHEVDIAAMKGKVILVDFWATWCGPCVAEVPNVLAAYNKFHDHGFEIAGIDLDEEKSAVEEFVKKKGIPWPQYFDGKGWKNAFAQQYGINSIPTMWLVDKKGILRDMSAREGLAEKVQKLLDEQD